MAGLLANRPIDKARSDADDGGPGLPRPTATAQPAMFAFTSQAPGAVRPYLLLGAAPHEADYMLLKKLGVTHILQVRGGGGGGWVGREAEGFPAGGQRCGLAGKSVRACVRGALPHTGCSGVLWSRLKACDSAGK